MKKRTIKEVEDMLGTFNLLLWAVEKDCGKDKRFSKIKKNVMAARKELHNVPQKGLTTQ